MSVMLFHAANAAMLPLVGLFRRPEREAGERKALMIAAHVVWGAALGLLADRLASDV